MEEPNNYDNFDNDYKESVKYSINDGSYFKDAYSWYCDSFLKSIVDRTFFVFMSIMGIIIIYNVVGMIFMILPLKENIFIVIREKDLTRYVTRIRDLSQNNDTQSTDEDILRFLLINYVTERESHNYKTGDLSEINRKLTRIGNNSSADVFNEFRNHMSSTNQDGPYHFFGRNIETSVTINSFNFLRIQRGNVFRRMIDFFDVRLLPIGAEVFYTLKTQVGDNVTHQKRKAVIGFNFTGVEIDRDTGEFLPISFTVTSYRNYDL